MFPLRVLHLFFSSPSLTCFAQWWNYFLATITSSNLPPITILMIFFLICLCQVHLHRHTQILAQENREAMQVQSGCCCHNISIETRKIRQAMTLFSPFPAIFLSIVHIPLSNVCAHTYLVHMNTVHPSVCLNLWCLSTTETQ